MSAMPADVVLLHGFAGTGHAWDAVSGAAGRRKLSGARARHPRAMALPAPRGRSASTSAPRTCSPRRPGGSSCAATRWAGGWRCTSRSQAPERVDAPRARLDDRRDRGRGRARAPARDADLALAGELERGTIEEFAERWLEQPLFAGDGAAAAARARDGHRSQRAAIAGRRAARHRHRGDDAALGAARRARRRRDARRRRGAGREVHRARRAPRRVRSGRAPRRRRRRRSRAAARAAGRARAPAGRRAEPPSATGDELGAVDAEAR